MTRNNSHIHNEKQVGFSLIALIVLILLTIALITFYLSIKFKKVSLRSYNYSSNNSFILIPKMQQEPRVFIRGAVINLPRSQQNFWVSDNNELLVCGEGGLYIYNALKGSVTYFYKLYPDDDWYPCRELLPTKENTIFYVKDSKGEMLVDINTQRVLERDKTNTALKEKTEVIENQELIPAENHSYGAIWPGDLEITDSICEDPYCVKIAGDSINIEKDNEFISNVALEDLIALVGIKNNELFYAVDATTGSRFGTLFNHELWSMDIITGKKQLVTENFRADHEVLVFIHENSPSNIQTFYNYDEKYSEDD